jgi:protein TonB
MPDPSPVTPERHPDPVPVVPSEPKPEAKPKPETRAEAKPEAEPGPKTKKEPAPAEKKVSKGKNLPPAKPEVQPKPPEQLPERVAESDSRPEQAPTMPPGSARGDGDESSSASTTGEESPVKGEPSGAPAVRQVVDGDLLKRVSPRYPMVSRRRGEEGEVVLLAEVSDGRVVDIRVERSSGHDRLDGAAVRAVKGWRFRKGLSGMFRIPVIFRLQ